MLETPLSSKVGHLAGVRDRERRRDLDLGFHLTALLWNKLS